MVSMKVRVGIVGAGGIAKQHLKILSELPQVEIVAICDKVKETVETVAVEYKAEAFTDAQAMIEAVQMDALFVCVPPFAHGLIEELAAERGIHLLIEKPIGLDMAVVKQKSVIFRKAGIIVSTGYCLRYLDSLRIARDYLKDKKIATVRAERFSSLVQAPWWRDMSKSGGQLVEMTTHTIDMIRFLAGDVSQVYANAALLVHQDVPGISIPDVTSVQFVLESGAIGQLTTAFIPQPAGRSELEIAGDQFHLTLSGTTVTIQDMESIRIYENTADFSKEQDTAFIQAILTKDRSSILAPYEEAMRTLEVTLAANESIRTGKPVLLTH
jgi:predicted dehydrogenase